MRDCQRTLLVILLLNHCHWSFEDFTIVLRVLHLFVCIAIHSLAAANVCCRSWCGCIGHHIIIASTLFVKTYLLVGVLYGYEFSTEVMVTSVISDEAVEFESWRSSCLSETSANGDWSTPNPTVLRVLLLAVWTPLFSAIFSCRQLLLVLEIDLLKLCLGWIGDWLRQLVWALGHLVGSGQVLWIVCYCMLFRRYCSMRLPIVCHIPLCVGCWERVRGRHDSSFMVATLRRLWSW